MTTQLTSSGTEKRASARINRSEDPLLTTVAGLCIGLFFLLLGVAVLGDGFHHRGKMEAEMLVVGAAFAALGSLTVSSIANVWLGYRRHSGPNG